MSEEVLAARVVQVGSWFGWPPGYVTELAAFLTDVEAPMTRRVAGGLRHVRANLETFQKVLEFSWWLREPAEDRGGDALVDAIMAGADRTAALEGA